MPNDMVWEVVGVVSNVRPGSLDEAVIPQAYYSGLAGAWLLSRFLDSFVYGITTTDPIAFTAAPVALLAIATLAALVPAWRVRLDENGKITSVSHALCRRMQ